MQNLKRKIISFLLVLTFIAPAFLVPRKAEAQWVVFDPSNFTSNTITASNQVMSSAKEWGGDTIVWILVNVIIQHIAASTVNWINSGFQGSPAFVTNPDQYFGNLADGLAGQLIYSNPNWKFMCAPFRDKVQLAVNQAYLQSGNFSCTLSGVVSNFDGFMGDFNQGGWDGFLTMSQRNSNNPMGLYVNWQEQLYSQIATQQSNRQNELNYGQGFMSWRKCLTKDQTGKCTSQDPNISTPGSVIQNQLNTVLASGNGRLQVADEVNEIISALFSQLISKGIGAIGNGLRSLSGPDSGNNNQTYTSDLNTDANTQAQQASQINPLANVPGGSGIPGGTTGGSVPCSLPDGTIGVSINGGSCQPANSTGNGQFVPIIASDGSTITGPPLDPDCALVSFDDIVKRASEIYYADPTLKTAGITIANILENMDCGPGGTLP